MIEFLLPLVLAILVFGLAGLIWLWPRGHEFSFSQHAAQSRGATIYYSSLFLVAMPLFAAYFMLWFQPKFGTPILFIVCTTLAATLQITCTFFPEKGRWVKLHRLLAGLSAALLIPSLALLLLANVTPLSKGIIVGGIIAMLAVAVVLARDKKRCVPYALQLVYYAAFFVPIIWIACVN